MSTSGSSVFSCQNTKHDGMYVIVWLWLSQASKALRLWPSYWLNSLILKSQHQICLVAKQFCWLFQKKSDSITKIFTRKMAKWLTKSQIKKRKCSKIVQFVKEHYLVRNDLDKIWHSFVEQQVSSNLELVLHNSH